MKYIISSLFLLLATTANAQDTDKFGNTHHRNHNDYSKWRIPGTQNDYNREGTSCCNNHDCDIVKMFFDINTEQYYIIYKSKQLYIPPKAFLVEPDGTPKKSPDGNAHACVIEYEPEQPTVVCAVNGDTMF